MQYSHLTLEERERIYALSENGSSSRSIGRKLGRSHTTISRELKRNAPYKQEYIPCKAHKRATNRARKQRLNAPLKSPEILLYVREKLREDNGWSPEIISGRLTLEKDLSIHHETIYRYIYHSRNKREQLWQYLPLARKKRQKWNGRTVRKYNRIPNAVSIEERPEEVQLRKEYGDWETDLMEGPRISKPALQVNVERKYRYAKITKIPSKNSTSNTGNMVRLLKRFVTNTITGDNGLENVHHEEISARLGADFYFCHPYSSWEKGTVENRIKVIRRFIPKGSDLSEYSNKEIGKIEDKINNMPMKCLGWYTPAEKMREEGHML